MEWGDAQGEELAMKRKQNTLWTDVSILFNLE